MRPEWGFVKIIGSRMHQVCLFDAASEFTAGIKMNPIFSETFSCAVQWRVQYRMERGFFFQSAVLFSRGGGGGCGGGGWVGGCQCCVWLRFALVVHSQIRMWSSGGCSEHAALMHVVFDGVTGGARRVLS